MPLSAQYIPILVLICFGILIAFFVLIIPKILIKGNLNPNKLTPYECGFDSLPQIKKPGLSINFYLIAMLFIIFDLEILFLIPWAIILKTLKLKGFLTMMFFLSVILIGLFYQWKSGALNWD